MPITLRRFPVPPAALLLLAAPLGCNSDSSNHPETGGKAVTRSAPTSPDPGSASGEIRDHGQPERIARRIHQNVREAAGGVEDGLGDLPGEVSRTVGAASGGERDFAGALRAEASRAAAQAQDGVRQTVDQVVGGVQREVKGAQGDIRQRARSIRDGVKQSARGLKKDVVESLLGPPEE